MQILTGLDRHSVVVAILRALLPLALIAFPACASVDEPHALTPSPKSYSRRSMWLDMNT
jgi:hypothetical protein